MVKVLVVEDEEHARTGLTGVGGESWGYRASSAANGIEGLEKVVQWLPAIVVTDLKMPRMDGMMLLNRIGEMPERIAVVMLTAQGSIESAVEAMRLGAFDYLPKPVDPVRLKQILHTATLQKETDVELRAAAAVGPGFRHNGRHGGKYARHESNLQDGRAGGAVECAGVDHRRERDRQGACRTGAP